MDEASDAHVREGYPRRAPARARPASAILGAVSTLYDIPAERRARAGAGAVALSAALVVAGIAPLVADAPAWVRVAGVLLLLLGLLLGLIASGLLNSVRLERRHRAARQAQFEVDAAAAAVCARYEERNGLTGSPCGPEGCGGACALAGLRGSQPGA